MVNVGRDEKFGIQEKSRRRREGGSELAVRRVVV